MTTFKPVYAIGPILAASFITMAVPASAAPGMTGRPDLASATRSDVTEVRWRSNRGAAAAGIGFAAGALIGAAAAGAMSPSPYYYGSPSYPYGSYGSYGSYGYYQPAPTYYYQPSYSSSYGYYGQPRPSSYGYYAQPRGYGGYGGVPVGQETNPDRP